MPTKPAHSLYTQEDFDAVMDNDVEYFEEYFKLNTDVSYKDKKEGLLDQAFIKCKIKVMKFFLEQGVSVKHEMSIRFILEKKKKVEILEFLEAKGIDLTGNVCLLVACLHNNEAYAAYLANKISDIDSPKVKMAMTNMLSKYQPNLEEVENILNILLPKLSLSGIEGIIQSNCFAGSKKEVNKIYLRKKYLDLTLTKGHQSSPTMKI